MPKNTLSAVELGSTAIPEPVFNSDISLVIPEKPCSARLPRKTKAALLRDMLLQPAGASLQGLMSATGWQAHTVRAALSGLRKAGVAILRTTSDAVTIYKASAHIDAPFRPCDDKGTNTRARDKNPTTSNIITHRSAATADATNPDVPL